MAIHTTTLWQLITDLYSPTEIEALRVVVQATPFDYDALVDFDRQFGGPSIGALSENGHGRYAVADRDVFRPLQYCSMYLGAEASIREWTARETVHMAGLHLESLIKRVGRVGRLPLGGALRHILVRPKLDPVHWQQLVAFSKVYNAAKHDVDQAMDTHLFSVEDAILAYCICRRLAISLYAQAGLMTDLSNSASTPDLSV